jgi:hypothetical protein
MHGFVDEISFHSVRGWALDEASSSPVTIRVFKGEELLAEGPAELPRPDVAETYGSSGLHGFELVSDGIRRLDLLELESVRVVARGESGETVLASALRHKPIRRTPQSKRAFFFHVPKTAGTSIAEFVASQCAAIGHVEQHLEHLTQLRDPSLPFLFVSGHVSVPTIADIVDRSGWFLFTFLRDPVDQLASHIKWCKYIGSSWDRLLEQPEYVRDLCERVAGVDIDDVDGISRIIDEIPIARQYLDNVQVRYLAGETDEFIGGGNLLAAIANSEKLDFVGISERVDRDMAIVFHLMGWPRVMERIPSANVSRMAERPNLADPAVAAWYRKMTQYDQQLYEYWLKRTTTAFALGSAARGAAAPPAVAPADGHAFV